jgi:hypothetical protein
MSQNFLDLHIFKCSSCPVPVIKTVKTGQSGLGNRMVQFFLDLPNLVINTHKCHSNLCHVVIRDHERQVLE